MLATSPKWTSRRQACLPYQWLAPRCSLHAIQVDCCQTLHRGLNSCVLHTVQVRRRTRSPRVKTHIDMHVAPIDMDVRSRHISTRSLLRCLPPHHEIFRAHLFSTLSLCSYGKSSRGLHRSTYHLMNSCSGKYPVSRHWRVSDVQHEEPARTRYYRKIETRWCNI